MNPALPPEVICRIISDTIDYETIKNYADVDELRDLVYECVNEIDLGRQSILARELQPYRNLRIVEGWYLQIEDYRDIAVILRLQNYMAVFSDSNLAAQFYNDAPQDHFLDGHKFIRLPGVGSSQYFKYSELNVSPKTEPEIAEILIRRQLFNDISFPPGTFIPEIYNRISRLKNLKLRYSSTEELPYRNIEIWKVPFQLEVYPYLSSAVGTLGRADRHLYRMSSKIDDLLEYLEERYRTLPNINYFIAPLRYVQVLEAIRIFPSLKMVGLYEPYLSHLPEILKTGITAVLIFHHGPITKINNPKIYYRQLPPIEA